MDHIDQIKRLMDPLQRRLRTMLMRGNVTAVDDSGDLQKMQVARLEGEVLDDCERLGQYGFTSCPPIGSEVIVGQIGSNADHQVILGVEDKSRPHPIEPGQSAQYDVAGTKILCDGNGNIFITCAGSVTVTGILETTGNAGFGENVLITGNLVVLGTINGV